MKRIVFIISEYFIRTNVQCSADTAPLLGIIPAAA